MTTRPRGPVTLRAMSPPWPVRSVLAGTAGTTAMSRLCRRAPAPVAGAGPARLRRLARARPDRGDGDAPAARDRPRGARARAGAAVDLRLGLRPAARDPSSRGVRPVG